VAIFGPFTSGYLLVNSVDLSARCKSISVNYQADMLDASAMGDLTKVNLAGLKSWSVSADLVDDMTASGSGSVDATLFPLIGAAAFAVVVRPSTAVLGATNPSFTGNAVLPSYSMGGAHGGLLTKGGITFQCAGALVRTTA